MLYDPAGTNAMDAARVASGPRRVVLSAATAGNRYASPSNLSVLPLRSNPAGAPTPLSGTRFIVGPGDDRWTVVDQTIAVTGGCSDVAEANDCKIAGSGGRLPRLTFSKVGDPAPTYAAALVEPVGAGVHIVSRSTAAATGGVGVNIAMSTPPAGSDDGCDVTVLNPRAFDTAAEGTAALPALCATKAATVAAPAGPDAVAATFAALAPTNFPTDLPPADRSAVPAGAGVMPSRPEVHVSKVQSDTAAALFQKGAPVPTSSIWALAATAT